MSDSHLMATYSPAPVTFVSGDGSCLTDADGREYIDFLCGIAVTSLGHAHPAVSEAVCRQARTLSHVSNLFSNDLAPQLAARIDALVSAAAVRSGGTATAGRVFFGNSGAEANECAIKLARKRAGEGRPVIVSTEGAFHGRTFGSLAATGQPDKQAPFRPLPEGFVTVPFADVGALISLDPSTLAAVIVEPLQGERGVRPVPTEFLRAARDLCDRSGAVLIADEIQTGLGRTGRWFGFEHHGVVPDIVTLAKSLGNGMPIGACWASEEVAAAFAPGDHGSTFGGQPLACSAALATLSVLQGEGLVARAEVMGRLLRDRLASLPAVAEVRGLGMLIGVGLDEGVDARDVAREALCRGLVVNAIGESTIRLAPALNISESAIEDGTALLGGALAAVVEARAA